MAQLAIKGHATRGKEVIEILEMLGGRSILCTSCYYDTEMHYYITSSGNIMTFSATDYIALDMTVFTVEQFLEKFPYKVGDKVIYNGNIEIVNRMHWDGDTVKYGFFTTRNIGELTVENLQPYIEAKEETKKDLDWHPTDYLEFVDNDEWAEEVELNLGNSYKILVRCGKTYAVKKKPQFPKTYEECCKILFPNSLELGKVLTSGYNCELLKKLGELLVCRDAYWKMAGDWKPDYTNDNEERYGIFTAANQIVKEFIGCGDVNTILTFPTEEMRDIFYENFKDLIETCKELF